LATHRLWQMALSIFFCTSICCCSDYGNVTESRPGFFSEKCADGECSLDDADTMFRRDSGDGRVGASAAIVGDMDGDGFDDIVIGDPEDSRSGQNSGAVYLIYGKDNMSNGLSGLGDSNAVFIVGDHREQFLGISVAGVGDVNGDGLDDLLIGAPAMSGMDAPGQGAVYLVPGRSERYQGELEMGGSFSFGQTRFIDGQTIGSAGRVVGGAGDVDGDGLADFLIGAPAWREHDKPGAGAIYLVYGQQEWEGKYQGGVSLDDVGILFHNNSDQSLLGFTPTVGAGDVNADGYADFLFGAHGDGTPESDLGRVFLVYGSPERYQDRMSIDSLGTLFSSDDAGFSFGSGLSGVGDVDADGFDDIMIAAPYARNATGQVHLIYGRSTRFETESNLQILGATFIGETLDGTHTGSSLGWIGDLDANGFSDLIIPDGSNQRAGTGSGAAFILLGSSERLEGELQLSAADIVVVGVDDDEECTGQAGSIVSGYGDVNGDGFNDCLIGAVGYCSGGDVPSGYVYLVLGGGL
jgi:FG-GAP repeat protein